MLRYTCSLHKQACERDPRTKRRTVADCYLIIIQRWTKIETLLSGIISDTIGMFHILVSLMYSGFCYYVCYVCVSVSVRHSHRPEYMQK